MGAGMYTGYTDDAFKFADSGLPSLNKGDYTKGSDGLYYYNNNSPDAAAAASAAAAGATDASAAAAGAKANQLAQAGESAVGTAATAAASNLSNVQSLVGTTTAGVNAALNQAESSTASMNQSANALGGIAQNVLGTASKVGAQADIFQQYAESLQRDSVFAQANALPWLEQSSGLLSGDQNATGIAGEWNRLYDQMSPDAQAASAATDTRKAASVAEQDLMREMSRRGVSAGSSAVAAALGKLNDRVSANVAAMMTAAHKSGLTMQSEALKTGFSMALQASSVGKSFTDEAITATQAAAQATGQATAALNTEGSLQSAAASIVSAQGNLFGASGNLALGIASNRTNNMSASATALTGATNTQVNAQAMAADYYSTQGGSLTSMLTQQGYNVLSALFGMAK